jgi:cytochrome b561
MMVMDLTSHSLASRYGNVAQFLHWLTAVLVTIAFIVSVGGPEDRVYSPADDFSRDLHELLGVAILVVTLTRLLWRVFHSPPPGPELPQWMERTAKIVQWALYALLLLAVLTAVLGAWLECHPLTLLAMGSIDPMIPESHQFGNLLADLHGLIGDALIWLAGLHAAAALYHHVWLQDDVLRSMLPWEDRRR